MYNIVSYGALMQFEWDDTKATANLAKHGVAFDLASEVWDDPLHVIYPDRVEAGEQRWHAIGVVGHVALLLVVHSYPGETGSRVRIISARKATRHERKGYEQEAV